MTQGIAVLAHKVIQILKHSPHFQEGNVRRSSERPIPLTMSTKLMIAFAFIAAVFSCVAAYTSSFSSASSATNKTSNVGKKGWELGGSKCSLVA